LRGKITQNGRFLTIFGMFLPILGCFMPIFGVFAVLGRERRKRSASEG
jgi:hypothetical protein